MLTEQRAEFCKLISGLLAGYGRQADEFALGAWWQALGRFDLASVRKVLVGYAATNDAKFAPRPAQISKLLSSQVATVGGCELCRHSNPANRQDHWLRMELGELRQHLLTEYRDYYDKHPQELGAKLSELADVRQRYSGKVDEHGNALHPADAFDMRMRTAPATSIEASIQAHIKAHDLHRKPGESVSNFVSRCQSAGDWEAHGIKIRNPRDAA